MRIDIMTLFPEMCGRVLDESIIGRSRESGLVEINCVSVIFQRTNIAVWMIQPTAAARE